ncbi:cytochrome c oxidase assembly protein [Salibacterium qingdaonense]|uniref:Cytochrome c oxidase assembly factor CtaG n=1 Tax=Salibacterium qingdaonense TaxID=266892 RepID=A0A1I4INS8_9BACI|nr:cytochrome c oxidase assembly protein [Salibacterium qingdaonense]SFL55416.1 cytochrome c oxidase assembly factor CtaG [Salibacterium qingdaonense]
MSYVWSIVLLIITIFIIRWYFKATKYEDINQSKKFSFLTGVILFFIAQVNPLFEWGSSIFFVHMMQQTVTFFIAPIFIFLGMSDGLLKPLYSLKTVDRFIKILTKPIICTSLFTILFSAYYVPFIFDTIIANPLYRITAMIIMLPFAFFMWWPVLSPAKNDTTFNPFASIIYIVVIGVLFTPLGIFVIFSGEAVYSSFALRDQQVGGAAWKVISVAIYIILMGYSLSEAVRLDKEQAENKSL